MRIGDQLVGGGGSRPGGGSLTKGGGAGAPAWLRHLFCLAVSLIFALFAARGARGAEPPGGKTPPGQATVSVFLLGVRDFDQRRGSYIMDFYLDFKCPDGCTPEKFEFTNGTILTKEEASSTPGALTYRVTALLYGNLDMRKYPFDRQDLHLSIEDKVLNNEALRYVADEARTASDPGMQVSGWNIVDTSSAVDDHYYLTWDESYSRYTFRLKLARPILSSLLKGILPAFLVGLCSFFALMLPIEKINRLTVLTSTFITAVLLHLNSTGNLPPVSYLTYMDMFMLVNYAVIVGNIGLSVLIGRTLDAGETEKAMRLNRRVQVIMPATWLLAQGVCALTLFF
jgi:hypothetical protein